MFGRGGVDLGATIVIDLLVCPAALFDIAAALRSWYKYKRRFSIVSWLAGEEWWLAASPKGNYIIRESVRKPDQLASSSVEESDDQVRDTLGLPW